MPLTKLSPSMRVSVAQATRNELGTNGYYLGIGHILPWLPTSESPLASDTIPPDAIVSNIELSKVWNNAIGMKKIILNDISLAIRRIDWVNGIVYDQYNANKEDLYLDDFYVMNSNYEIYKCLFNNYGLPSVVMPSGTTLVQTSNTDGYIWRYMYTVPVDDRSTFLMSNFIPVNNVASTPLIGELYSINVIDGGTGYSTPPVVTINGNGSGASAYAVIDAGVVTKIVISSVGSNYTYADVVITGSNTTPALAVANISVVGGHGSNIIEELYATNIIIAIKLSADEDKTLLTDNDIRQAFIVKAPKSLANIPLAISNVSLTTIVTMNSSTSAFTQDAAVDIYATSPSPIKVGTAAVAYNDTINNKLYLTNITSPTITDTNNIYIGVTPYSIATGGVELPIVKPNSGDIIYVLNRTPIIRNTNQTEAFKIPLSW